MANGEAFSIPHHDLVDRSIDALAADLADGRMSARELTQAYIDRIEATNTSGPASPPQAERPSAPASVPFMMAMARGAPPSRIGSLSARCSGTV